MQTYAFHNLDTRGQLAVIENYADDIQITEYIESNPRMTNSMEDITTMFVVLGWVFDTNGYRIA